MTPGWLTISAAVSLLLGGVCTLIIVIDILAGHRQRIRIMNVVWPLTALYSGPLGLWFSFGVGRLSIRRRMRRPWNTASLPRAAETVLANSSGCNTHCGAGCALKDIVAKGGILSIVSLTPFARAICHAWAVDFVAAFLFGIAFQYFTIKPMRRLSPIRGLIAARKADALSLTAWQVGMHGWMAAPFVICGHEPGKTDPMFCFMTRIAILAGFLTSFPVNWRLVASGLKDKM